MSQLIDTPAPWWQVMVIGRNPRTTLVRLAITAIAAGALLQSTAALAQA